MMEIIKKKKPTTKTKNIFDGIISTLDTAEEILSEPGVMTIETSKIEKQRKNTGKKKRTEYPRTVNHLWKV